MKRSNLIQKKIKAYNPQGGLAQTARVILAFTGVNQPSTRDHVESVALLAEAVAKRIKKDAKAAFFAGLLHDAGKMIMPPNLFDGHNITPEEYDYVKTHARAGFQALWSLHKFTALCAGFHHRLYEAGYGTNVEDFPSDWSPSTIKKVLDISIIVSICDFVEAFTTRKTKLMDGSNDNLKELLYKKYPDDLVTVDAVLLENK